jgi:VWFA-related protein
MTASILAVSLLVSAVFATASTAQPDVLGFRSTTALVQVNVIVTGKGGPILDLSKDDFTLLDRGKPRPISAFMAPQHAAAGPPAGHVLSGTFSKPAGQDGAGPVSATVLLLDCLNTSFRNQTFARREVIKWLRQVDPQQRIALYLLAKSLHVVHDFTSDPNELIAFLTRFRGVYSSDEAVSDPAAQLKTGIPELDAIMEHLNGVLADHAKVNRGRVTLGAMEAIANHLSGIPGRKNLVWVSGGFPFSVGTTDPEAWKSGLAGRDREMTTFRGQADRVTRLFNQANIVIYPVDAGGLAMDTAFKDATQGQAQGQRPLPVGLRDEARSSHETMEELASGTGGRAFYNSNDLSGAIERAVADADATYTLGFYPDADDLDGKFHNLTVKTRREGVRLRFRKGYIAYAGSQPTDADRTLALRAALISPLPATGIDLTLRISRKDAVPGGAIGAEVVADTRQVTIERRGERLAGSVEALFAQQDAAGAVVDLFRTTIKIDFSQEEYAKALDEGLILRKTIQLKEKAATVRIVVQDRMSGALGSLVVPASRLKQP